MKLATSRYTVVRRLTEGLENLIQIIHRQAALEQGFDALFGPSYSPGNLVDVLWLDNGLEVIFQQLREVV